MPTLNEISENLATVRQSIEEAAKKAGRDADDVTLVAVSKTHPAATVALALQAGWRVFGENKVQEAEEKWPALKDAFPDAKIHLIGPLQRNKAKRAVALFDVIETLDRPKLARALVREMEAQSRRPDCYIQVNTGEEEQKAGVLPADVDAFVTECRDQMGLPIVGLMCIPPVNDNVALHFGLLAEMARRNGLKGVSMGMSADYPLAVEFGATLVRVGTAIFGQRQMPHPGD